MKPRNAHSPALLFLALLAALASCERSTHRGSTTVVVSELEPNDFVDTPHYLGVLDAGKRRVIRGSVTDAFDPFFFDWVDPADGFAFTLTEPSRIDFTLWIDAPANLDVCVYDPDSQTIPFCFEDPFAAAFSGSFFVDPPVLGFHLIVGALAGTSDYTLEVRAYPSALPLPSGAPSVQPSSGLRLPAGSLEDRRPSLERTPALERYLGRPLAPPVSPRRQEPPIALLPGRALLLDESGEVVGVEPAWRVVSPTLLAE